MWWILLIGAKSGINNSATLGKSAVHKIFIKFSYVTIHFYRIGPFEFRDQ